MSEPPHSADEPDSRLREKAMGFWDHLDELRQTIIKSVVVFVLLTALIGYYLTEFNRLLMWPFYHATADYPNLVIELGTASMTEGVSMIIQMCMLGGLMLSAPFILLFIGQFVAPALTERELKTVLPMCVSALGLFLLGAAFGFFCLVPGAVRMAIEINVGFDLVFRWTVGSYYSILINLVLGVGATFESPLLIILLVWLGIVSTATLRQYRRHAIVVIFIVAAIITPTQDPFLQALFAAPLCLLFEIALLVATRIEKRRDRSGAAALVALLALWPRRQSAPADAVLAQ